MLKLLGNTFKIRARRFIPATAELITGFSRPKSYKVAQNLPTDINEEVRDRIFTGFNATASKITDVT
ncbi:hypothetical protein AB4229_15705 [Vibrio breoganii]